MSAPTTTAGRFRAAIFTNPVLMGEFFSRFWQQWFSNLKDVLASKFSGTFTPDLTLVANIDDATIFDVQYSRNDNVVTVSGMAQIDPTVAGTDCELGISLLIPSAFTTAWQCVGTASAKDGTGGPNQSGLIRADVPNARASLVFNPTDANAQFWSFIFSYLVL